MPGEIGACVKLRFLDLESALVRLSTVVNINAHIRIERKGETQTCSGLYEWAKMSILLKIKIKIKAVFLLSVLIGKRLSNAFFINRMFCLKILYFLFLVKLPYQSENRLHYLEIQRKYAIILGIHKVLITNYIIYMSLTMSKGVHVIFIIIFTILKLIKFKKFTPSSLSLLSLLQSLTSSRS